jgi:hypothetical protein
MVTFPQGNNAIGGTNPDVFAYDFNGYQSS